jgi:hypothetical protein
VEKSTLIPIPKKEQQKMGTTTYFWLESSLDEQRHARAALIPRDSVEQTFNSQEPPTQIGSPKAPDQA